MLQTGHAKIHLTDLTKDPLGRDDRDSLNIAAVIRFIRRSWRLCLIWIFASLCAATAFMMLARPYYTAYATILLEERAWRPQPEPAAAVPADPTYADSQVELLQSDEVVGRVIDQRQLMSDPEFGGRSSAPTQTPRHATMIRVKQALSIRRVGVTNIVEIGFTSTNATRAATIVNAIAQSYIDGLREQNRAARADAAARVRERLAELREKAFATDSPSQTTPDAGEPGRMQLRELQNSAEIYRALYNNFLQRAYTESDPPLSGARVITPAEPPMRRSWPRVILVLAIAVVGGAAVGLGHSLLRQAMDHSLRSVEDVERSTGLDRIAVVPKFGRRVPWFSRPAPERFLRRSIRAITLLPRALAAYRESYKRLGWRAAFVHHQRSCNHSRMRNEAPERSLQSVYLECSPSLRDVMSKMTVRLHAGRTNPGRLMIGVAAPTRGAGASSVAAHLAMIIASTGQKTLLVDANWQKPSAPGMTDPQPDRKLASTLVTIPSKPCSLRVLVLRATALISEFNATLSIASTLQQLEYDCVVIDFHAAEQTADLEGSMAVLNELIVVAEAGQTSSDALHGFVRLVPREKMAGIILNKVEPAMA